MDRYYTEQLERLRKGAVDFAKQYPAIAPMLLEEGDDPDVERILEGTAWLCAKIHERLDETAPELVQSLLRLLFPQAILPVPSMTLMRFMPRPGFTEPIFVEAGTQVASNPVDGVPCLYSTISDLTVLPAEIVSVRTEKEGVTKTIVTLSLRSLLPWRQILEKDIHLQLTGSYAQSAQRFMALLTACTQIVLRTESDQISLPPTHLTPRILPLSDLRLPQIRRGSPIYMELLRYFHFPEQLLAVTVSGFDRLRLSAEETHLFIEFHLQNTPDVPDFPGTSFLLNVVPAANIFRVSAEPLVIDHTRVEYTVRPQDGIRRFLEILDIENASALFPGGRIAPCRPYEAFDAESTGLLYSLRYQRSEKDGSIEHLLMPLYRQERGEKDFERCTLSLDLVCCNHSLPGSLQIGDICRPTDSSPSQAEFTNIVAPAPMLSRHFDENLHWRFISHMNANLLSLASARALRSLLELYVPEKNQAPELYAASLRRVQAVTSFSSTAEERLFRGRLFRGRLLELTLDPTGFVSKGDLYLFASVLERFFSEYANLNTYTRLRLTVGAGGGTYQWPPRLGQKQLI